MRWSLHAAGALCALLVPGTAVAQIPVQQTPRQEYQLPEAEIPEGSPEVPIALPPPPPPQEGLAAGLQVRVEAFQFAGNTVFSDTELAEVVAPWTGREISSAELQAARQALTAHYVEHGYVTSGALLPDQKVETGVVDIRIVEGRLSDVEVVDIGWFRPSYFRTRLMLESSRPLQIERLERRLQLFQQDVRIRRIQARLVPGEARGEAVLRLVVEEELPFQAGTEFANDKPASVGELTGRFRVGFRNVTGFGDQLLANIAITEGVKPDADVRYRVPFTPWDTSFEARFRLTDSGVVESPFDVADIENLTTTVALGFFQPVYRTPEDEVRVGLIGAWRRSESEIDGFGFGFPGTGASADGISKISVLRIGGDWIRRTRSQVLALRTLVNVGLPVLGATENPSGIPDSRFVSWLTQFQWAQRFPELFDIEAVLRADLQLANDPLMTLEQIGVGGMRSVRGYRENQIVRDQAVIGSLELRYPVWRSAGGRHLVQFGPFVDVGHGWNRKRDDPSTVPFEAPRSKTLTSVGVGIRYRFARYLRAEFYWGGQLNKVPSPSERSLQDDGIYFSLRADFL